MEALFSQIPIKGIDEGFALLGEFLEDPEPCKVSLGAGVYRDDDGKPWVLPIVRKVENEIVSSTENNHEYLAIEGHPEFLTLARDLVLGTDDKSTPNRTSSIQTISGTGANTIGATLLSTHLRPKNVWISNPSWPNHHLIWELAAPQVKQKTYPYYDKTINGLDFPALLNTLRDEAYPMDVVILHPCAHNPTGIEMSRDQWQQIADLCAEKSLFAFFDCAYQGFATGNIDNDAWPIRSFLHHPKGIFMAVAYSFSKNFGLYGERVGAFHFVIPSTIAPSLRSDIHTRISSELQRLQRGMISNPPSHGAKIVATILSDHKKREQWTNELRSMATRLEYMRECLYNELKVLQTPGNWHQILTQIGMFSYTGLTASQASILKKKYHLYIYSSGRISIAGLNTTNVKYVAMAIDDVVRSGV